ncbi:uncharacterized protein LOC122301898 [Carya illinoinensis]|uniref:uncharacterized protein LOC122301898 n=1 Tax=Carya illinoinensis TaxID=32201 RepID=UPI001C719833|nr:uncharacterized protein LOC122301898 [Carya illinoinensis]
MDASWQHLDYFWIGAPGTGFKQEVEFKTLPAYCLLCKMQGHNKRTCRKDKSKPAFEKVEQQKVAKEPCEVRREPNAEERITDVGGNDGTKSGAVEVLEGPIRTGEENVRMTKQEGERGLGTSRGRLKKLEKKFNIKVVALAETFVDERKMDNIKKLLWLENGCSNQAQARKIWLLWDKSVDVNVVRMSDQFIMAKISEWSTDILLTFVYAKCNYGLCRQLWKDLEEEAQMNLPWMILGDFNVIRTNDERRGGAARPMIAMEEFNSWISGCGLLEISSQGNRLTWCNGQEGLAKCWAWLDREFINTQLLELLPQTLLTYLERNTSDHSPMIVSYDQNYQRYGPTPFRFQQMWMEHKDFFTLAKKCWEKEETGRGLEKLAFKLKQVLKTWNKEKFGRVETVIRELEQRIEALDLHLQEGYEEAVEQDLLISKMELETWKKREESMLAQKAKVKWLRARDNNTRFFHSVLKRRQQNQVNQMLKADGTSFESPEAVHKGAVTYFQELLSKGGEGGLPELNPFIDKIITEEENKEITKSPSVEEIQLALFSIPTESSPGPDGFGSGFYRHC